MVLGWSRGKGVLALGNIRSREKKPLLVESFYGTLPDAKENAEAAILRLKERSGKRDTLPSK